MSYKTAIRAALAQQRQVIIGHGKRAPIYAIAGGDGTTTTEERDSLVPHSLDDLKGKTPEELRQLIEVLDAHLKDLHQTEDGELRDKTPDEQRAFDTGLEIRDKAIGMIEEHERISAIFRRRPKAVERVYANIRHGLDDTASDIRRLTNREARDRALRVLDDRTAAEHLTAPQKDEISRQVRKMTDIARRIIVTENDDYREAWLKAVTDPNGPARWTEDERRAMQAWYEYRAMSEGTTTAGGFGVPVKLAA